jgi:hypothetical protein
LNPVRAKIVRRAEDYRWSSHRAYVGLENCPWLDSDEVLRYFGAKRKRAVETYRAFVNAGDQQGHREELYGAVEGRFLGGEEFVGEVKHRIGDVPVVRAKTEKETWDWTSLVRRVEAVLGVKLRESGGQGRTAAEVRRREVVIYVGRQRSGLTGTELGRRVGLDPSNVVRGYERARERMRTDGEFRSLVERVLAE